MKAEEKNLRAKTAAPKKTGKPKTKTGKAAVKSGDRKPWEQMYQSAEKAEPGRGSGAPAKKPGGQKSSAAAKKPGGQKGSASVKKPGAKGAERELRNFLYLLPRRTTAKALAEVLDFLPKKDLEIWDEECVLEIGAKGGTITFEDIRDSLEKADKEVLSNLRMKQVISCDYEAADAALVRKVMEKLMTKFGGRIGSDTEDFTPFLSMDEI